jgi:hypothetical protein
MAGPITCLACRGTGDGSSATGCLRQIACVASHGCQRSKDSAARVGPRARGAGITSATPCMERVRTREKRDPAGQRKTTTQANQPAKSVFRNERAWINAGACPRGCAVRELFATRSAIRSSSPRSGSLCTQPVATRERARGGRRGHNVLRTVQVVGDADGQRQAVGARGVLAPAAHLCPSSAAAVGLQQRGILASAQPHTL